MSLAAEWKSSKADWIARRGNELRRGGGNAQGQGKKQSWGARRGRRGTGRGAANLFRRLDTWNLTVRSAMLSLLAISLLERFSSSESRTSCSRRLRLDTWNLTVRSA